MSEEPTAPAEVVVPDGAEPSAVSRSDETDADPGAPGPAPAIVEPAKLLRIASMVRELLDETRQASLDEPGRARLRQIYDRSVGELRFQQHMLGAREGADGGTGEPGGGCGCN